MTTPRQHGDEHPILRSLHDALDAAQRLVPIAFAERDAARAEVAALRSAADNLSRDWMEAGAELPPESGAAGVFVGCSSEIDHLLASVGSSGEAESGEATHASYYGSPGGHRGRREDCKVCPPLTPAPVSPGVQADGEAVTGGVNYEVVAARLAARPVLSREALRGRLDGHWPTEPRFGTLVCSCTRWRSNPGSLRPGADQWLDHLADVLTAGGEQRG